MKIEAFLSKEQEESIAAAIASAEKKTSGEIKVHIDRKCSGDALERTRQLFAEMSMHETQFHNAVLIYIATDDHKLAIFGDEGIHSCVGETFWKQEIDLMTDYFKRGEYHEGLLAAINLIAEKLQSNFPFEQKGDTNELDNEVSYGSGS